MRKISRLFVVLALIFSLTQGIAFAQVTLVPVDPQDKKQEILGFLEAHPELITKFHDLISIFYGIENTYVDEKSKEEIADLAMKGMVSGLDPYSRLMIGQEAIDATKSFGTEDKYVGVGMSIMKLGRECVITSVFKNSPAQKAGLEPGDFILKVDKRDVSDLSSSEIVNMVKGDAGTAVYIEVTSKRFQKPRTFLLTRANVIYASVDTTDLGKYGYVKINHFVEETPNRIKEALEQFRDKKGLVLDLRDNPGGLVVSVNEIIGFFVGKGQTTIITKGRMEQFNDELKTDVERNKYPAKVVVLVNNFSASASEILAGNLQYYKVAKVLGVRTFGKAVGQSTWTVAYDDKGNIRLFLALTTFRYFLPDGRSISDTGVVPDAEVEQPENFRIYQYGTKKDRQLQEAIKFLKKK